MNYLSEMHRDALCGGGRIVQLMRKTGGHCSERLQLFLLSPRNAGKLRALPIPPLRSPPGTVDFHIERPEAGPCFENFSRRGGTGRRARLKIGILRVFLRFVASREKLVKAHK
jgi:hypothetical protein